MKSSQKMRNRIELFTELFVNRDDMYSVQYVGRRGNGYRAVRRQLTPAIIARHLQGQQTLGLYALSPDSKAKWLVVDLDTTTVSQLEAVLVRSRRIGLPDPLIENSGRRGYHCWWFFEEPVRGWKARRLGMALTREHEVFPKQATASRDTAKPGSLVKAPLGIHRVSGKKSFFLATDFKRVQAPWALLARIEKVDVQRFASLFRRKPRRQPARRRTSAGPLRIRPCIKQAFYTGAQEGHRNDTGHLIACEMRRLGLSREHAVGILTCWNLRNMPSLDEEELQRIVNSAYRRKPYVHGCGGRGRLRSILTCVGETCPCAERET